MRVTVPRLGSAGAAASPPPGPLETVVSIPRFSTYEMAAGGDRQRAAELYGWNARVSAALLLPMHFAEIAARNVVHEALSEVDGSDWPWNPTFRGSLPDPRHGYNPKQDLCRSAGPTKVRPTGKVVAELKFVFWQMMFTSRHDNASGAVDEAGLRQRVYNDLEAIRKVRNRVAHHEPIHASPLLADDLQRILDLVDLRCTITGRWVRTMEDVSALLPTKP